MHSVLFYEHLYWHFAGASHENKGQIKNSAQLNSFQTLQIYYPAKHFSAKASQVPKSVIWL